MLVRTFLGFLGGAPGFLGGDQDVLGGVPGFFMFRNVPVFRVPWFLRVPHANKK